MRSKEVSRHWGRSENVVGKWGGHPSSRDQDEQKSEERKKPGQGAQEEGPGRPGAVVASSCSPYPAIKSGEAK